jgi:hypothetical protein
MHSTYDNAITQKKRFVQEAYFKKAAGSNPAQIIASLRCSAALSPVHHG